MSKRTNKKRSFMKPFLALMLAVVMLCSVFPAGALVLDAEMLDRITSFVKDSDSGKLDVDDYKDFIRDYLEEIESKEMETYEPETDAEGNEVPHKSYLDRLHDLLTDGDGTPEYGKLVDEFKRDPSDSDESAIHTILGVLQKVESVEEVFQFMEERDRVNDLHADAAQSGTTYDPVTYPVEWYLNGTLVKSERYEHQSVLFAPEGYEAGLNASHYINWHTPAFFLAPTTPGEVTRYYGTVDSLAEDLVDIINGSDRLNKVYTASVEPDGTVLIIVNRSKRQHANLILDLVSEINGDNSQLNSDMLEILAQFIDAGLQAGVQNVGVDGYSMINIDDYELPELLEALFCVLNGEPEAIFDVDGFVEFAKAEMKWFKLERYRDLEEFKPDVHTLREYTLNARTEGVANGDIRLVVGIRGDVTDFETTMGIMDDILTCDYTTGNLTLRADFSDANLRLILKNVLSQEKVPQEIKDCIIPTNEMDEDGDPIYVLKNDTTVGEFKQILLSFDYDDMLDGWVGSDTELNEKIYEVIEKLTDTIPERFDHMTIFDLYAGNSLFCFDATLTENRAEEMLARHLRGKTISLLGQEVTLDAFADRILEELPEGNIETDFKITVQNYHRIILKDKTGAADDITVFTAGGLSMATLLDLVSDAEIERDGYRLVFTLDGNVQSTTPGDDATLVYEWLPNDYTVHYCITLTDPDGVVQDVYEWDEIYPFGSYLNPVTDVQNRLGDRLTGYTVPNDQGYEYEGMDDEFSNVPAGQVTVRATYVQTYLNVTWIIDGNEVKGTVLYGQTPVCPVVPTKPSTLSERYDFAGWSPEVGEIRYDTTYVAQFLPVRLTEAEDGSYTYEVTYDEDTKTMQVVVKPTEGNGDSISLPLDMIYEALEEKGMTSVEVTVDYSDLPDAADRPIQNVVLDFTAEDMEAIKEALGEDLSDAELKIEAGVDDDNYLHIDPSIVNGGTEVDVDGLNTKVSVDYVFDGDENSELKGYVYDPATGTYKEIDLTVDNTEEGGATSSTIHTTLDQLTDLRLVEVVTQTFTVTFLDKDGNVLSVQTVVIGGSATLPEIDDVIFDTMYKYTFSRWEGTYTNVMADQTVQAKYDKNLRTFEVTFIYYDANGVQITDTQNVYYGYEALEPIIPSVYETADGFYTFVQWNGDDLDALLEVTSNLTYEAEYTFSRTNVETDPDSGKVSVEVKLENADDSAEVELDDVLADAVTDNKTSLEVTVTYPDGSELTFEMTNEQLKDLADALGGDLTDVDLTIKSGVEDDPNSPFFGEQHVDVNITQDGQSVEGGYGTVTAPFDFDDDEDTKLYAYVYNEKTGEYDRVECEVDEANGTVTIPSATNGRYYLVEELVYDINLDTNTQGGSLIIGVDYEMPGFPVTVIPVPETGYEAVRVWYTDATGDHELTLDADGKYVFDMPESDVTIKAEFRIKTFTVTFYDGIDVLKTQTVEYGAAATAPATPVRPNDPLYKYVFSGWSESYTNVTSDLNVYAQFRAVNPYESDDYTVDATFQDGKLEIVVVPHDPDDTVAIPLEGVFESLNDDLREVTITVDPENRDSASVTFGNDDLDTLKELFGDEANDMSFSVVTAPVTPESGYPEGFTTFIEGTFVKNDGTPVSVSGLNGARLSLPFAFDDDPETVLKVYYFNPETQELETVEFEADEENGVVHIITTHFSGFVMREERLVYQVGVGAEPDNGTLAVDVTEASKGDRVTLTLIPDEGYEVDSVWYVDVDGNSIPVSATSGVYSFVMPKGDVTVMATFKVAEEDTTTPDSTDTDTGLGTETETGMVGPGGTDTETDSATGSDTESETETDTGVAGTTWGAGKIILIVLLIILILLLIAIIVGYILYRKGILPEWFLWLFLDRFFGEKEEEETAEEAPAPEEPEDKPLLFVPLGEEIPEEEPEEIHQVESVSVDMVDELMSDKAAELALDESDKIGGTGKLGIVNIGSLNDAYQNFDTVNLENLKEKDLVDDNIGRLKVLASGKLDKSLTVEADAFSVQAIKMITLTGGHAVRLKDAATAKTESAPKDAPADDVDAE